MLCWVVSLAGVYNITVIHHRLSDGLRLKRHSLAEFLFSVLCFFELSDWLPPQFLDLVIEAINKGAIMKWMKSVHFVLFGCKFQVKQVEVAQHVLYVGRASTVSLTAFYQTPLMCWINKLEEFHTNTVN